MRRTHFKPHEHDFLARPPAQPQATRIPKPKEPWTRRLWRLLTTTIEIQI